MAQSYREATVPEKYGKVLKAISIVSGLALILLGILSYIIFSIETPIDVILPFYFIIFGVLMIAAEFNIKFIVEYFGFIHGYIGRGVFYIFVGTLCINQGEWFNYIVALCIIVVGCIYICCYCGYREKAPEQQSSNAGKSDNPRNVEFSSNQQSSPPPPSSDAPDLPPLPPARV